MKVILTFSFSASCSGLINPDTNLGGKIAAREVFNEKTASIFLDRI